MGVGLCGRKPRAGGAPALFHSELLPFGSPLGPVFPDSNSPELVAEALQSWVLADIQDNELMA